MLLPQPTEPDPSQLRPPDLIARQTVPAFFALATLIMAAHLGAMVLWPASRAHEFAPLVTVSLNLALAFAGWRLKALHSRRALALYWLFLACGAFAGIVQMRAGLDSMLTGSFLICTVMAGHLLEGRAARVCWVVPALALPGLYTAQVQGWLPVAPTPPLQGLMTGWTLLALGLLQARCHLQAAQAAAQALQEQESKVRALAEQSGQATSEFLSVMSHEIRTPLNGIVGLVELAQDHRVDETSRSQYLQLLSQSSQALSHRVSDVLDFQKIESGRVELQISPFSLVDWCRDLDHSFSASAAIKGLFLRVELDRSAGDGALGDAARLRQIAAHYISNAIKFTKAGSISVRVSRPRGDALLRLEVRDSGIGLTDSAQALLFQPSLQADMQAHRHRSGNGLGLSICERLARRMKGSVGVNSRPGVGSTFWAELELPMTDLGRDARSAPASPAALEIDLHAARVLVVDDNPMNRTVTQGLLRRMNALVTTAEGALEGLDAMRQAQQEGWPFDAVLMDVQMPGMTGLEAVRAIRADGSLAHTPVVALTAGVLQDDVRRAMEAGMDGFLAKPIGAARLGSTVAHFVMKGRQRRAPSTLIRF